LNTGMTTEILGSTSVDRFMPRPWVAAASALGLQPCNRTSLRPPSSPVQVTSSRCTSVSDGPIHCAQSADVAAANLRLVSKSKQSDQDRQKATVSVALFGEVPGGSPGHLVKSLEDEHGSRSAGRADIQSVPRHSLLTSRSGTERRLESHSTRPLEDGASQLLVVPLAASRHARGYPCWKPTKSADSDKVTLVRLTASQSNCPPRKVAGFRS
jgi:hypothetical protein